MVETEYKVELCILFDQLEIFYQAFTQVVSTFKSKHAFCYEVEVEQMLNHMTHALNNQGMMMSQGNKISFNLTKIKDLSEKGLFAHEFKVKRILPLVQIEGLLYVTNQRMYFQPYHNIYEEQVVHFSIRKFQEFFKRRFKLMEVGLQVSLSGGRNLFLAFASDSERNMVHDKVNDYLPADCRTEETPIVDYTRQWVKGQLSNFDYLSIVNTYAQRSTLDLTQYPVFPWVITDYKSPVLDLKNPSVYRDLSLPIGAMNKTRLADFTARYYELPEEDRYLYGTHYSCPGYVIGFLVRQYPQWMIKF